MLNELCGGSEGGGGGEDFFFAVLLFGCEFFFTLRFTENAPSDWEAFTIGEGAAFDFAPRIALSFAILSTISSLADCSFADVSAVIFFGFDAFAGLDFFAIHV